MSDCRVPMPVHEKPRTTNWGRLFGTPERAAGWMYAVVSYMENDDVCQLFGSCSNCPYQMAPGLTHCNEHVSIEELLEWLESEAEG